jgi:hypothetical protein
LPQPDRYVSVKVECSSGHPHDICVEIKRQVPTELRCQPSAPAGYSSGGGSSCQIPGDAELVTLTERELRDNFQDSKRQGYVLIRRS